MRPKQLLTLTALCFFIGLTFFLLQSPSEKAESYPPPTRLNGNETAPAGPPTAHPIHQLITEAESEVEKILSGQSKTLREAVREYKRRYKIPPPPNFDKWYDFAKAKGVKLIDEYDTIYHSLLPFWALDPSMIRGRAREALGFDNALIGVLIRDGRIVNMAGGDEWQRNATKAMVKDFVKYLPDMDLAFNHHDEPRVIVPHDDLSRLVQKALDTAMPAALSQTSPKNAWSPRPIDISDGTRFPEVPITRFNRFAHQPTWTHSRLSCPPDSPSRSLSQTPQAALDDLASYTFPPLGFIRNKTAFSDICLSPSLSSTYGFFDRPNAFDIVHDLFPIFSQSKISSFQDILYPSPWYYVDKVPYKSSADYSWSSKENKMFWRGSTTGGFSRDGGWRRQHRQTLVRKINAKDDAKILEKNSAAKTWSITSIPRPNFSTLFDVKFSHVGQCDDGDCAAQREFFDIADGVSTEQMWAYKYLLDIDGNAFSGRFYAFLKSKSLVFKMAVFREWHEEWIVPWAHYIPFGLRGEEYLESVRYFDRDEEGQQEAKRVATKSKEWAEKVLRNEDLEVWFFRLLLEYGRLVDEGRETIGYSMMGI
ncbi:MAG: capsule-associated protein CAP1 [Icmadophila ericetorum]|nr:capsule-associated protein CAP1 [Icmadophila ericetorum]